MFGNCTGASFQLADVYQAAAKVGRPERAADDRYRTLRIRLRFPI